MLYFSKLKVIFIYILIIFLSYFSFSNFLSQNYKLFNNKKTIEYDFANIPTAVFTSPQIGTVGLTLEMAKKKNIY